MTLKPEWIASGEPWVAVGPLLSLVGGGILILFVSATPKKGIVAFIGMMLLVMGCIFAIVGVLAMHGIAPS
jgi:hypothetical protein